MEDAYQHDRLRMTLKSGGYGNNSTLQANSDKDSDEENDKHGVKRGTYVPVARAAGEARLNRFAS